MKQMPVFLINLDVATQRFEFMKNQLFQNGIEFERISAVVGKELSPAEIMNVAPEGSWIGKRRPSPCEVGCFLSHKKVLEIIVERGLPCACILEDDVHLASDFQSLLSNSPRFPRDADVIKLEIAGPRPKLKFIRVGPINARALAFIPDWGWPGSAAYIVTLAGAKKLLADLTIMVNMYDWQAFDYARNEVATYHVLPLPAYQLGESEMSRPRKPPVTRQNFFSWLRAKSAKRALGLRRKLEKFQYQVIKFGLLRTILGKRTYRRENLVLT